MPMVITTRRIWLVRARVCKAALFDKFFFSLARCYHFMQRQL